jgi:hypothetical protein
MEALVADFDHPFMSSFNSRRLEYAPKRVKSGAVFS